MDHASGGGFLGDFDVKGWGVDFFGSLRGWSGGFLGIWRDLASSAKKTGEGIRARGAEQGSGGMRAVRAVIASAGGVEFPMIVGLGPEVDFDIVIVDAAGQDEAVLDFLEIEGTKEAGRGEFLSMRQDVLVKTMVPIRIREEGVEVTGHERRLCWAKELAKAGITK